jgi:aspartate kinase
MANSHTVEKIGGSSMSRFGDVMRNVIVGHRKSHETGYRNHDAL